MRSCMKHILRSENIWNKESDMNREDGGYGTVFFKARKGIA